jgi:hypothetical protein
MKNGHFAPLLAATLATLLLAACASETPRLDANFGNAVNQAKALQTINPDASMDMDPVTGVDGVGANAAIDNYQKSYEKPATKAPAFSLGTGTSGTSGGSGK